ncbi:MAG: Dyp-type peroxidase, partial [Candidatus Eremiobacteraeota bacterium]|nr:Dyp-type peroxidase [Candidatus Eremiobacteraeota bacterium]
MAIPQTGIFALGDASHTYLEFSVGAGIDPARFVQAVVDIHEPHTTVGGVNLVIGFRPELWRTVAPDDAPAELIGFNEPLRGARGYAMPATQSDAWLWIAGASYDVVFDLARAAIVTLRPVAKVEREIVGWSYRHSRDLTGFED